MRGGETEVVDGETEVQELVRAGGELVLTDEVWLQTGVERGDDGGERARGDGNEVVAGAAGETDQVFTVSLHLGNVTGDEVVAVLAAVDLAGWQSLLAQINFDVGKVSKDQIREGLVTRGDADVVAKQLQAVDVCRVGAERQVRICED